MATPESPKLVLELRRSRLGTSAFGALGDKAPSHRLELYDDRLVVPTSDISARRVEVPLDQLTGIRVVPELMRATLTVEAGARVVNLGLGGKKLRADAQAFVAAVRAQIEAQPHGDLTLERMNEREAAVSVLVAYRARAIWAVVPLLLAAYAVRLAYGEALFDLDYFGASARSWLKHGELYRMVTAAWLHANLWHIGGNLVAIVWLGRALERAVGAARLIIIMTVATITGSLGSTWLTFGHTIGASGVGMGIAAAFAVVAIMYRGELPRPIARPAWWWAVFVLLMLPSPDGPGLSAIDHAAHVGGAFGGALAAFVMCARRPLARIRVPDLRWLAALALTMHVAALAIMAYRVVTTEPLAEVQRLTALVRAKLLSADEANAVSWSLATKKDAAPQLLTAGLQLAEAAYAVTPGDVGLADTVATLHHRTGSDRRAAELEARTLDAVAETFDATGFATQLARFMVASGTPASTGITIEASDKQVKVRFAEGALGLAASGVTIYAVSMRHGHIEGLLRLKLGAGPTERYVKVPPATGSIWNDISQPIAVDADYGTMLMRTGCGCKDGSGTLDVWSVDPEVLGWP